MILKEMIYTLNIAGNEKRSIDKVNQKSAFDLLFVFGQFLINFLNGYTDIFISKIKFFEFLF